MKKQLLSGLVAAALLGTVALPVSAQNLAIVNGKAIPKERAEALKQQVGIREFDFVCSGSSDYLAGQSFAFVAGLDAVGAWPPVYESHVEMDGAWALFEGFVRLQLGE